MYHSSKPMKTETTCMKCSLKEANNQNKKKKQKKKKNDNNSQKQRLNEQPNLV